MPGTARGVVFAFTSELEEWLRRPQLQPVEATESDPKHQAQTPTAVPHLAADGMKLRTAGIRRHAHLLPWVIAGTLAAAVFADVYSYRQTARFAARAAGSREAARPTQRHIPSSEVQDLYLKGRYYWSKRTPEDLNKAVDYFTQAIVKDPGYAPAFVGLADCYNLLREFSAMPQEEAYPRALAAAQKAVELDDSSAEAHNSLAFATYYWGWDAAAAERDFKRALDLNPGFVQGHHWYATFLAANRRFPEALDQIEQARKLDPSSTTIVADKGWVLLKAGRTGEALALLKPLESTDPGLATIHDYLAEIYFDRKDYAASFAEAKQAARLRNDAGALAVAEAAERGFNQGGMQGLHEAVLRVQEKLLSEGKGSAYALAATCAALGKNEDALRYLQSALEKRDQALIFLTRDTVFNALHNDPAYRQIATKVEEHLPKSTFR
jgi:tetratricopeptide (TPR) repeat protein